MKDLVRITKDAFKVELDIRYATNNNITGESFYKNSNCYLHLEAAKILKKSVDLAKLQGFSLKIFDGFRPIECQKFLFNKFSNSDFVSNPEIGAIPHCRGIAVDLTLVDSSGKELEMGTDFDDFTELSFHGSRKISALAQRNRYLLLGIMTTAGWDFYRNEWWHYQLFSPREYPVINL